MVNQEGNITEVKSFKECCSNCGHVSDKKYSVRYRVNQKHTIKNGYIPEYTVETFGLISPEHYFEVLTDFELLLETKYPQVKIVKNEQSAFKPEDAGI